MELCSGDYVLAMTSFLNKQEDYGRLLHALMEIDENCKQEINAEYQQEMKSNKMNTSGFISRVYVPNEKAFEISEAVDCNKNEVPLTEAAGKLAGDYVYLYPPGIPLLVPGEIISAEMIENITECIRMELDVKGVHKLRINIVN
jgi:arginine/lysine/ornithine decarboxylase